MHQNFLNFNLFSTSYEHCLAILSFAGKGVSIWDTYVHTRPFIIDGTTGDIAADSYHQYKQDIKALKELGVSAVLCKTKSHVKCNREYLHEKSLLVTVLGS
jgi:hypothetical protein